MKMYYVIPIILIVVMLLLIGGCVSSGQLLDGDGMENSYAMISQEEAQRMMQVDDGHIIVDVRRQDEFDEEHIPGAICIPNESISDTQPAELPDLN